VKVGIDLLEIDRLERALERRPRLAERLFTDGERAYAATRARPGQHLAARFCAKEAIAKALELPALNWREVEIVGGDGPPSVRLHGAARAQADELGLEVSVSLTHSQRDAAAAAVAAPAGS
jgi:holo-[acyl-carrier protein] synthase